MGKKILLLVLVKFVRMIVIRLMKVNIFKLFFIFFQLFFGYKSVEEELDVFIDFFVKNLENISDLDFFGEFINFIVDRIFVVNVFCFFCVCKVNF